MAQLDDDLSALFASGQGAQLPAQRPQGGSLFSLPGQILRGYQAAYGALPQRVQDAATSRQIDLATKQAALAFLNQRREMLQGLLPQLMGSPGSAAAPAQGQDQQVQPPVPEGAPAAGLPQTGATTTVSPLTVSAPAAPSRPSQLRRRSALAGLAVVDDKPSDAWSILKGDFTNGPGGDLYDKTDGTLNGVRVPVPEVINGQMTDRGDPANIGHQYPEPPAKGALLLFDGQGNPAAWRLLDGTLAAVRSSSKADALGKNAGEAAYAGTIAGAKAQAQAPFTPVQTNVGGVPTTISASQLPGAAGARLPQIGGARASAPTAANAAPAVNVSQLGSMPSAGAVKIPQKGASPSTAVPVTHPAAAAPAGIRGVNPADEKRMETVRKQADDMEKVAGMADDFMKLNATTGTGPANQDVELPIPFAHTHVDINPLPLVQEATNPNFQAMEGITSRAAPLMRPEGSGRIMQQEYQKFLEAFPNVRNLGTANAKLQEQLHSEAANRRAYANFASDWLTKNGSLAGADAAWAQQQKQSSGAPAGKSYRYDPKTGALELVQ